MIGQCEAWDDKDFVDDDFDPYMMATVVQASENTSRMSTLPAKIDLRLIRTAFVIRPMPNLQHPTNGDCGSLCPTNGDDK